MALSYLTATVTQGSADAFAQAEMATALSGITNVAYRVREILFEQLTNVSGVDNSWLVCAISRRSKAAVPKISDRDVLASIKRQSKLATSGAFLAELVNRYQFDEDDDLLIVEDPLYIVLDSDATTVSNSMAVRIGYERVSINAVDRLTLLTNSLD